jgi:hypothetical protein
MKSLFDRRLLRAHGVPEAAWKFGIANVQSRMLNLHSFLIDATDVVSGTPAKPETFRNFAKRFASFIVWKRPETEHRQKPISVENLRLSVSKAECLVWIDRQPPDEASKKEVGRHFFAQTVPTATFALIRINSEVAASAKPPASPLNFANYEAMPFKWNSDKPLSDDQNPFNSASDSILRECFARPRPGGPRGAAFTFVIDAARRAFSALHRGHTVATVAAVLGSIAKIEDRKPLRFDVVIAAHPKVFVAVSDYDGAALRDPLLISSIVATAESCAAPESAVGSGLAAAQSIAAQRSLGGCEQRIFVFTDGVVSLSSEIEALAKTLSRLEDSGVTVVGVGVGRSPHSVGALFPNAVHAPRPALLGAALGHIFGVKESDALKASIQNKPFSVLNFEAFLNLAKVFDEGANSNLKKNSADDAFLPNSCGGYAVLVVALYFGAPNTKDAPINAEAFDRHCGAALRRLGFAYEVVSSYATAEAALCPSGAAHRWRFVQTWLFCSPGAADDHGEVRPFFAALTKYWRSGGGLLFFCGNDPFTFELNLFLSDFATFPAAPEPSKPMALRFGGHSRGNGVVTIGSEALPAKGTLRPEVALCAPPRIAPLLRREVALDRRRPTEQRR